MIGLFIRKNASMLCINLPEFINKKDLDSEVK